MITMMWRVAVSFILVLILGCAHSAPNGSVSSQDTQGLRLIEENLKHPTPGSLSDDEIRTILLDNVGFGQQADGIVVGVVDERGPRAISAGVMGDAAARAVDGDTLFRIGSITKVFNALLLQDMHRARPDEAGRSGAVVSADSVKMPTHGGKRITVFDLATHMSPFRAIGMPSPARPTPSSSSTPSFRGSSFAAIRGLSMNTRIWPFRCSATSSRAGRQGLRDAGNRADLPASGNGQHADHPDAAA
jgi:CubicO group peptidase (beta-lactamase class C family)